MGEGHEWLGHEGVPWNILLSARLSQPPDPDELRERLDEISRTQGWPEPTPEAVVVGTEAELLRRFSGWYDDGHPVSVGRMPDGLVVRAHHAAVDGLGVLALLRELTAVDVSSGAAGVTARATRSAAVSALSRLLEVAMRPPAPVPGTPSGPDDVFASLEVDRAVRTAELVRAVAQALRPARRVAVAVGVSTAGGRELRIGDDSGFLRLTGVEGLDLARIEHELQTAPLQIGGTARTTSARRAAGLIRWASRRFASRLGSTVLVSHLGRVTAPGLARVAFYPMSGTGSGVSLGAATVDGTTTLTLRARGSAHGEPDLARLLASVADHLGADH